MPSAVPPPLQALVHLPRVSAFPPRRTWPPDPGPVASLPLNSAAQLHGSRGPGENAVQGPLAGAHACLCISDLPQGCPFDEVQGGVV